ncbi:beta-glucosidase A [Asticcacaulis biprosthecium C19]|uniref:Beta-glucosidase A n=1 Tax=Asticcacaulis biprosthecium C19 TaxID=715226 RepID=F4QNW3_9CAUL|nr:family 1 glycosylhydrolase [Asticcacaulis biprosthecium]EGF91021.1 beta-glucosidase A [Asticcacaulis biprosthecium C19]
MTYLDRRSLLAASAGLLAAGPSFAKSGEFKFPKDFLWGAATSGHQVEGNNVNSDMWLIEHVKGSPFKEPSRDAVDHYHLFEQDIALLARLGLNSFRFSLEWARIEPARGEFSAAEMNHYVQVAQACLKHGVKPVVTYNHYAVPVWFAANGGFENPESADLFARFCEYATAAMGPYIAVAATFNEPQLGYVLKWMLPDFVLASFPQMMAEAAKVTASDRFASIQFGNQDKMLPNLLAAHKKGYEAIKAGPGDFPVGVTMAFHDVQAVGEGSRAGELINQCYGPWLEAARASDFVGVQNYSRIRVDAKGPMHPEEGVELTQMGEEFWPEALEASIRYAYAETQKPVYVTENGVATEDDTRRVEFINRAVKGVANCLKDGVPVKSYLHWSLIDNFEWVGGYGPKFGLIAVDRTTQKRTVKPSAVRLGQIAKANRI